MSLFQNMLSSVSDLRETRRHERLTRLLEQTAAGLADRRAELVRQRENVLADAAFALEAWENGADEKQMNARIESLTASVSEYSQRIAAVAAELDVVEDARQKLSGLQERAQRTSPHFDGRMAIRS